jgi:predicted MFS family arabinose efflux permease
VAPLVGWRLTGLSAGAALATLAAIALGTFLVAAAVDTGFSESAAGLLLFAGSVSTIVGRVVAGVVTDRIGGRGFGGLALLMGTGAVLLLLLPRSAGVVFGLVVLGAFATAWGWPGLMTYTVVNANRATAAASSGITQAGVFAGAGGGPLGDRPRGGGGPPLDVRSNGGLSCDREKAPIDDKDAANGRSTV